MINDSISNKTYFLGPEDDLHTVLACFQVNQVSHIPVINETTVIGMISKTDVIEALYLKSQDIAGQTWSEISQNIKAKELMIQPIVQADVNDSQESILQQLLQHQVSSVVLKSGNRIAGIVTERDMLQYLADYKSAPEMNAVESMGIQVVEWMDKKGLLQVSKILADMGI